MLFLFWLFCVREMVPVRVLLGSRRPLKTVPDRPLPLVSGDAVNLIRGETLEGAAERTGGAAFLPAPLGDIPEPWRVVSGAQQFQLNVYRIWHASSSVTYG